MLAMRAWRQLLPWLLFPVLSGADLFLTWRLLGQGRSAVYESNPVAAWCLGHFGWAGLVWFKLGAVVVVLGACLALSRRRPRAGAGVLSFGCIVLAAVVMYSSYLAGPAHALDDAVRAEEVIGLANMQHLEQEFNWVRRQQTVKRQLAEEIIAGRCGLPEAVERFLAQAQASGPGWLRRLGRAYALDSARDSVAANLLRYLLRQRRGDPATWERRSREWIATYRARYHMASPPPWQDVNRPWPRRT
jgi:hypothetical protein